MTKKNLRLDTLSGMNFVKVSQGIFEMNNENVQFRRRFYRLIYFL